MERWQATFEIVTPMFLSGADQKTKAELRAASLRGVMRWWFRAMRGDWDGRLSEAESALFGATDLASPFRLRCHMQNRRSDKFRKEKFGTGVQYFGFSMDAKRGGEAIQRKYLPPRCRFEVTLAWPASLPLERKRGIVAALWLATWLGGMGSRSRRGFGSMRVTEVKNPGNEALRELPFTFQGDSQQLHDFLETNLRRCVAWIGRGTPPDGTSLPDYSVLHPKFAKLYLWKTPFREWERAMDEAGTRMMNFRRRYPLNRPGNPWGDYQEVKKFLQHPSKEIGPIRRAAFGLPIEFYFTSLPPGSNKASVKGKKKERRASPLFVRVVRLGDQRYGLLFLLLRAKILPEGEPIMIKARSGTGFGPQPDFTAVEEFLDENVVPQAWEVSV